MVLTRASSPFGSRSRTRILVALHILGYSYPRALARLLETPIFAVRKALAGLERDGLVASRLVGRTRVYALATSYPARDELAAFLARLADLDADLRQRAASSPDARVAAGFPIRAAHAVPAPEGPEPAVSAPSPARDGWRNW